MTLRRLLAIALCAAAFVNLAPPAKACGPNTIDPIFVFQNSPDPPFADYARGNLGIVLPSFGRKTLFIAYRYLNGGSFTAEEQLALVDALNGEAPEDNGAEAVKAWIAARKEIAVKEEKPPEIYTERPYGGYDFFPNCTKNAFEVATATLKNRASAYGPEDWKVRAWLAAQDVVFQNCQSGGRLPAELGPEGPVWLRKDRDYQIAAALLYSMDFDAARLRFEKIAADSDSPWQETAEYLVGRTLVRHASLIEDKKRESELYAQAENHLQMLSVRRGRFSRSAQALLALVKYRSHPEARVRELAAILTNHGDGDNLKQDLIDYVWLLDKFEDQVLKEEEKRQKAAQPEADQPKADASFNRPISEEYQAIQRGERFQLVFYPRRTDSTPDQASDAVLNFKADAGWPEVLQAFETRLSRSLTPDEQEQLNQEYQRAVAHRKYLASANRKFDREGLTRHEGCYEGCDRLTLNLLPEFLRDDLSDWIFTVRSRDPESYGHALAKWRDSGSPAWLIVALSKAERNSSRVEQLMREAENLDRSSPAFPTAAHNLIRLKIAFGRKAEARKLLDEIIHRDLEGLPVSARNQFLEQRMQLSENVRDFLRFSRRKAAAFYDDGALGKLSDLLRIAKGFWEPRYYSQTKEEYEQQLEETYASLLPWDDRSIFDDATVDILNWHFPMETLRQAARDPALPDYQRRQLVLAIWTRAILLREDEVASAIAPDVIEFAPEMKAAFKSYLEARTRSEKEHAALFILLQFPSLSPLITGGLPEFTTAEESSYYFESSWWCTPEQTEYNRDGDEVPKAVSKPTFLTAEELEAARKERAALIAIGDGNRHLGKRVIQWAEDSPDDPRLPEALFIAAKANESYKYGCQSWANDQDTLVTIMKILEERYPNSPWTDKLPKLDDR